MEYQSCWEFTKCGREQNCPAFPHHGRACFAVTGTWCRGQQQPSYEAKIGECREVCGFYKDVMGITLWESADNRAVNE